MSKKDFFTAKQRDEIKKQALSFWDAATQKMSGFFSRVNDYDDMYHTKLPQDLREEFENHPDRSAMVPSDIHNNIRSLRANVNDLLFNTKPYITASYPGQPARRDELIDKTEILLSYLIDISKFQRSSDLINQQTFVAGRSACVTEWHREYQRVPILDEAGNIQYENDQILYDYDHVASYPRCRPIDIRRIRIDDKAENVEDIRIVGYQWQDNLSDLIRLNRDSRSFIKFKEKDLRESSFQKMKYYEHVPEEKAFNDKTVLAHYGDKPVEMMEFRGMFQIGNEVKDLVVKIANRNIVVECRPNNLPVEGWRTFDLSAIDDEYNRIFTMGMIERIEDTFVEYFIKRNQSLDASNAQTYDMYVADIAASHDLPEEIERRGGAILKVNLAATAATRWSDVFGPVPRVANPFDTFEQSKVLKDEMREGMMRNDYSIGANPDRKETATAVNSLEMAAIRDAKQLIRFLTTSYIRPVMQKYLMYMSVFSPESEIHVSTDDGREAVIKKEEIVKMTHLDITIDVSAALDRPMMQRRFIEALQLMLSDPTLDRYYIWKTAGWFLQYPNSDKINPPPEVKIAAIERENLALKHGIMQPVHPNDDHEMHIQVHSARADADSKDPKFDISSEGIQAYDQHIKSHLSFIERGSNNASGINTPKTGNGPSGGQLIGGSNPGMKGTVP